MDEIAIENLLIKDWASGLRITTVSQAMHRLGIADDLERRWAIANRMDTLWHNTLETPEKLHEVNMAIGQITEEEQAGLSKSWRDQVRSWDRASILLTDNEKLIARHILFHQKTNVDLPTPDEIATTVAIGAVETANGIRMLSLLGFLTLLKSQPVASYALAADHGKCLEGLGFSFHTVTLDDEVQFAIP